MLDNNMIVYLEDILIFTKTEAELKKVLAEVFRYLAQYSRFVKEEKYAIFFKLVEFLGHNITPEGISVQPGKTSAIKDLPLPRAVTEL